MRYTKKVLEAKVQSLNANAWSQEEIFEGKAETFILYMAYGSYALRTQHKNGGQGTVTELMTSRELGRYLDGMLKMIDMKSFR